MTAMQVWEKKLRGRTVESEAEQTWGMLRLMGKAIGK